MKNKQSRPPVSMAEGRQEENSTAVWSGATDAGYFETILPHGSENAVSTAALLGQMEIGGGTDGEQQ